jgi:hypothetical protein
LRQSSRPTSRASNIYATACAAHAAPPVAHEPAVAGHPSEATLDHPAAQQDLEARLGVEAAYDRDNEIEIGRFVEESASVIGAICEQVFDPGPAPADRIEDRLCTGAIGDISGFDAGVAIRMYRRGADHQLYRTLLIWTRRLGNPPYGFVARLC